MGYVLPLFLVNQHLGAIVCSEEASFSLFVQHSRKTLLSRLETKQIFATTPASRKCVRMEKSRYTDIVFALGPPETGHIAPLRWPSINHSVFFD